MKFYTRFSGLLLVAMGASPMLTGCLVPSNGETPIPLVRVDNEQAGPNCIAGGVKVLTGRDLDGSGSIETDEVESTQFICNGKAGSQGEPGTAGTSGQKSLVAIANEAAGENCPNGGKRVRAGIDSNENDALDDDEVTSTQYICDGADGAVGADGVDGSDGSDGAPGATGESSLLAISDEDAGTNCAAGGKRVDSGIDRDGNGSLSSEEIDATEYLCDGVDGENGHASLVDVQDEPAGAACPNGGQKIITGLDVNDNGEIDDDEIGDTQYVCNGADASSGGAGSLVELVPVHPGGQCSFGGTSIQYGFDTNGDQLLQPEELKGAQALCAENCGEYNCGGSCGACDGVSGDQCVDGQCQCGGSLGCEGQEFCYLGNCVNWPEALDTFGPITSIRLSNSTVTEVSGQAYQFSATGVATDVGSTELTVTFDAGSVTWSAAGQQGTLDSAVATTIPLLRGENTLVLTHNDGATDTAYTITMRRAGIFADLRIETPGVVLTPSFDSRVFEYTLSDVPYSQATIEYTVFTTFDEAGHLECSQCDWWQYESRGVQSMTLNPGDNRIDWRFVPGVSGVPDQHYFINVKRGFAFNEAQLSSITLSNATLNERSGQLYQYDATGVQTDVASTGVTAVFTTGSATWANGDDTGSLVSGEESDVPLDYGDNIITVTHSNDGVDTTYTIYMRRGGRFTELVFTTPGVTMTPSFDPDVFEYTLSDVPYSQTTLAYTVKTTFDEAGHLECSQCDWWQYESRGEQTLTLNPGENRIDWRFAPGVPSASDVHYYVTVNRGPPFVESKIAELTLSNASITERTGELYKFTASDVNTDVENTEITAKFSTGTVTWEKGSASGSLTSETPATIPLNHGDNTITITHTGDEITVYTIDMRRGGVFTSLVFTTPGVTMTPDFDPSIHQYTLSEVDYEQTTLSYQVSSTFDEAGYLECSHCDWWQYESRGTQTLNLNAGANCIDWRFNPGAQGQEDEHYYIKVNRGPVSEPYTCP